MAQEKIIRIRVETGNSNAEIEKLTNNIENIGDKGEQSVDRYSGSIRKSNPLVEKLNSTTGGLSNSLLDVGDSARKAGTSMKAAFISSGVGILIVGLGIVVQYWDEIVDFIKGSNKELEKHNEKLQESIDVLDIKLKNLKLEAKLIGETGEALEDNLKTQVGILNAQLGSALALSKAREEALALLKIDAERELFETRAAGRRNKRLKAATQTEFDTKTKERIAELTEKAEEARGQVLQLTLDIKELLSPKEEEDKKDPTKKGPREKIAGVLDDVKKAAQEEELRLAQFQQDLLAGIDFDGLQAGLDRKKFFADKERELEKQRLEEAKQVAEAKMSIQDAQLDNVGNGIRVIASLGEKSRALQAASIIADNAVGITKTIINTRTANAAATLKYAAIPGGIALAKAEALANNISAGISIAAMGVATGKGLAALGKGGKGLSAGANGTERSAPNAPSFNIVEGSEGSQITNAINNQDNVARAYVVSSEVTTRQELDRNIISNSRL